MIYENQEYMYPTNNTLNILLGMLIGGRCWCCGDAIAGAPIWKRYQKTYPEKRH